MGKNISCRKLKKEVWTIFSKYIRLKYADENGIVECVTCNRKYFWKKIQSGHFIQGRRNPVLFDERNVHPQCWNCNLQQYGNTLNYLDYMLEKYGQEVVDELRQKNEEIKQFSVEELLQLKENYQNKLKEYETKIKTSF